MFQRCLFIVFCCLSLISFATVSLAKLPEKISQTISSNFKAAEKHEALVSAYNAPDPAKMRGYVVMERGGIPAERARFYISWDDYDYRGVMVDTNKGDEISTRRGVVYTYLKRGDVMAIVDVSDFNGALYLKLMSADVYIPENRQAEKRHSRVTLTLGIKIPKEILKTDDAEGAMKVISAWLKPFSNRDDAVAYAAGISDEKKFEAAAVIVPDKKSKVPGSKPAEAKQGRDSDIKSLEEKINAAKKQMDDAEKELQILKKKN